MNKKYSLLFTGGLDSTYRLCQLARQDVEINPVYILFPSDGESPHVRPELQREIEAQEKIINYLLTHPSTKAHIHPVKYIHRGAIPKGTGDDVLTDVDCFFNWLKQLSRGKLGWQYYYIALYARWDEGVEICQERLPEGFVRNKILLCEDSLGRLRVNTVNVTEKSKKFYDFIYGNVSFPIIGVTRSQMETDLKCWGYDDVLKFVWFCYHAIDGKPCGVCDNCVVKLNQGLFSLFDKEAVRRYYICKVLSLFEDKWLKQFYASTIIYGEEQIFKYITSIQLQSNKEVSEKFSLFVRILKNLFKMDTIKLKRITDRYHTEKEVCDVLLKGKV